jgi:pyruvate kinase
MPARSTPLEISSLLTELKHLRESCLAMEKEFGASIAEACPQSRRSAQNLLHYLDLRQHDLRNLQSLADGSRSDCCMPGRILKVYGES